MTTTVTELAQDIGLARETDYYLMKDQLTEDELGLLYKVRQFAEAEILPVASSYWERDEFPFELVPKLAELNIVGDTMAGYGTTPMSAVGAGLVMYEVSRVDGSLGTFLGVHVGLAMQSIYLLGSEEQKQRWLPPMVRMEKIGAFALTEPEHGSDSVALETTARRDGSQWVLNGRKRWIGNAVWCDVIVVYARDTQDGQVKAFVVEKDNPGYAASKITGKVALRMVQNADITLTDCRVSDEARLANCNSFADVARVLKGTRNTVCLGLGRARGRRLRHRPELRPAADPVRPADREEPADPVDAGGDARRGHRHAAVLHPPRAADRRRQDERHQGLPGQVLLHGQGPARVPDGPRHPRR